ncbi:GDP-mannose 4,6-dehydratase [Nocardioides sp. GXZ039]|uniref:GDP-mannose 4,6-dehydratase n=1 Tax=Nocardioides sp. GXZ039 TaxID=3136018 RepID=UPI0030F40990
MTSRSFITGAGGQDGGYLAEALAARGDEVHVLALPGEPLPDVPETAHVHRGDVTDVEATRRLILDLAPDRVFNLAALSSVAQSWAEPDRTAQVNGTAAVALLESARLLGERGADVRFVQASSAEIFGHPDASPQDEATSVRPTNPYGAAKAYAHLAVGVYRARGLHASSLVLYNHESPRRPAQFVTRKVTSTVAAIANGRADRLTLGTLEPRRDWGWAPDYVTAMIAAADAPQADDYVIATGVAHSIRDLVSTAFARVGIDDWEPLVELDPALARPSDAPELVGDATRARTALGWTPTVDFEEIVARMVDADLATLQRSRGST